MTHTHRLISAAVLAMAMTGWAVSTLAQQTPTETTAVSTIPAPDYKTARDVFLKTKKFKTPAEQVSRAKEFLTALMMLSSERLNALKDRFTASDMPQDQIDTAAAEVDKAVRALNTLTADSASAATRADLVKVFVQAKSALKLARFTLKHQTVAFRLQRLGAVVDNLQTALEQMETRLNDLKIAGALTAQAAAELAGLKSKLSAVATSQRAAGSAVDALSIDTDFEATVNSAESVTAKVALSLRTIISSAQALALEVKSLAPAPTPPLVPSP